MKYKDALIEAMKTLAEDEKTVFLGQGVVDKNAVYGTLPVPIGKVIEMPIAENLIVGTAIGLALKGYKPVVIFQRMDFMTVAADAIINHLAALPNIFSEPKLQVIIRAIVGSQSTKFYCGIQHTKDLTHMFQPHLRTYLVSEHVNPIDVYKSALEWGRGCLVIEHKDLYGKEISDGSL